jgi:hypothetical protein
MPRAIPVYSRAENSAKAQNFLELSPRLGYGILRQINRLRTGENMEDTAVQALKIRVSVVQLRPWAPSN